MRALGNVVVALFLAVPAFAAPIVRAVTPNIGLPSGGTIVLISGSDLVPATLDCGCPSIGVCTGLRVWFGNVTATTRSAGPTAIVVNTPPGTGTTDIRLQVDGRNDVIVPAAFTWDPLAAPIHGESVRYLVPITAHEVPGAHGSLWTSELTVFNPFPESLTLRGRFCPHSELSLCVPGIEAPHNVSTRVVLHPSTGSEGAFLYVPRSATFEFAKHLRVRDVSRDAENFGSEVPIVDVDAEFAFTQRLLDVPTDSRYRALLRIYGPEDDTWEVAVAVYPASGSVPIETRLFTFAGTATHTFPLNPGYIAADPITDVIRASGHARVRVEVSVVTMFDGIPGTTIWTFLSLTNNATNQFTVITPQK